LAKVTGPLFSSEARGKLGGLIYGTHRGTSVVRVKHAPAQPHTDLQLQVRSQAIDLARLWQTNENQAAWNEYAAQHPTSDGMGNSVRPSGFNCFVGLNTRARQLYQAPVDSPPILPPPVAPTDAIVTVDELIILYAWSLFGDPDDIVEIFIDGPHSAGRIGSLALAAFKESNRIGEFGVAHTVSTPGTYTSYLRTVSHLEATVSPWISFRTVVT